MGWTISFHIGKRGCYPVFSVHSRGYRPASTEPDANERTIPMTIQTAAFEVAANRRYLFIETRAFAFFWDFAARPVVNRKARN
jgi:hypothetical protein